MKVLLMKVFQVDVPSLLGRITRHHRRYECAAYRGTLVCSKVHPAIESGVFWGNQSGHVRLGDDMDAERSKVGDPLVGILLAAVGIKLLVLP